MNKQPQTARAYWVTDLFDDPPVLASADSLNSMIRVASSGTRFLLETVDMAREDIEEIFQSQEL